MTEFIDATIFLGLHHEDNEIRIKCKNFFIERLDSTIIMSLDNVGKCDDVVWKFDRETQDAYYPFMDRIHTVMDINRIPYDENDIKSMSNFKNSDLSTFQKLTLAKTEAKQGVLYTIDQKILSLNNDLVKEPPNNPEELSFPEDLEKHYNHSLALRVTQSEIE